MRGIFLACLLPLLSGSGGAQTASPLPGGISTFAGTGDWLYSGDHDLAVKATLRTPFDVAVDSGGNVFIADSVNQVIRRVDAATQNITTVAGNGQASFSGDGGPATSASLSNPTGVAVDNAGNLYIADSDNNRVRKVDLTGKITTVAGSNVICPVGTYSLCSGDGGAATNATMNGPAGVAVDSKGNLYISDSQNNAIRRVDASSGVITTVTGGRSQSVLNAPGGIALDRSGSLLYVADTQNSVVRKVVLSSGAVSIVAGKIGIAGFSGDFGPATNAKLAAPYGVRVDAAGNLYIADFGNNRVRFVSAIGGTISTLAGNGTAGYLDDSESALGASLNAPSGVALDAQNNLYIADSANNVIRRVVMTSGPIVATTSLNFDAQMVNTSSTAQTITFTNNGSSPIGVSSIVLSSPDFQTQQSTCGPLLLPGASCALPVVFSPATGDYGLVSAPLVYGDSAGDAPQVVTLSGTGVSGQIGLNPAFLLFSNVVTTATQTVTIANTASSTLFFNGSIISSGSSSGFSIGSTTCGMKLETGASCQIAVQFSPGASSGTQTASLNLSTSASAAPRAVPLTATAGAPQAVVNTGSLSFTYQNLGTVSTAQSVTLTNPGSAPLAVGPITITGANAIDFSATNNCGSNVAPGGSCTVSITFTPSADGGRSATLTINNAVAAQNVALSGIGSGNYSVPGCTVLSFVAGPNPIYTNNPFGITSINANVTCPYEIRLNGPNGPLFATGNGYSSTLTGNWVTSGLSFFLQQSGNLTPSGTLANLTVQVKTGQGCIATAFTASPNPIVTNNAYGQTSITAATNCSFDIHIGAPNGPEFQEGRGYRVMQTGNWVQNQMNMYLQPHGDTNPADTLSVLTLVVQPGVAGCTVTTFSAVNNPIITTTRLNTDTIQADASCPYDIRVGGPSGALLGSSQGPMTAQTGNWVVNGLSFFLQLRGNTTPSGTLSTFTINTKLPDQAIPACAISTFSANPNPLPSAGGSAAVSVNANCAWDLRWNDSAGSLLTSGKGAGNATVNSVSDGTLLYLQPQGDTNWQHNLAILTLHAGAQSSSCSALVFSSTPIVADAAFGVTNITADATCPYDIRIDSPDGGLFGSGQGLTSANTGNWVVFGQIFYLQRRGDTTPTGTLATNAAIIIP